MQAIPQAWAKYTISAEPKSSTDSRIETGGPADAQVERRTHKAPRRAGDMGNEHPFEKTDDRLQDLSGPLLDNTHGFTIPGRKHRRKQVDENRARD